MPDSVPNGRDYSVDPGPGARKGGKSRGARDTRFHRARDAGGTDRADDPGMIDGLPVIRVVPSELPRIVDEAEKALLRSDQAVFSRAGTLVHPVIEEMPASDGRSTTTARLRPLSADALTDILAQVAKFQTWNERKGRWVNVDPPPKVAATLLAREGRWRLPAVAGVITTPTLRPDGSLLAKPGHDPATRLYLAPTPSFRLPDMPAEPTRDHAFAAVRLLEDLLSGFPFVGDVDRAVALSGIITAVVRGGMSAAPLHAIRAHTPGTGKSYLVDIVSAIANGRICPVIAAGKTEEETEKRLGALLLEAVPVASIDNVNGEFGGTFLCQMTERPVVKVRILGRSEAPDIESRSAVFATGNNLTLVGDMTRRTVLCTLDAGMERPETRDFDFNPVERVFSDRGAYVAACLTIVRAYRAAGSPNPLRQLGSYPEWSLRVRSSLVWLGCADPVASMETAREEDPELSAMRELFGHWDQRLGLNCGYTSASVAENACASAPRYDAEDGGFAAPEFRDLLLRQAGERGAVNTRRLGKWLSKISGRPVDGRKLVMKADGSNGNRFSLQEAVTRARHASERADHALPA